MEMDDRTFAAFVSRKAYEICYALFRLSGNIPAKSLSGYLEKQALALLISAEIGKYRKCGNILAAIEKLVRLGGDTNAISQSNTQLLIRETNCLNSAIAEYHSASKMPDIDISGIFTEPVEYGPVTDVASESAESGNSANEVMEVDDFLESGNIVENGKAAMNSAIRQSETRQSAILEKMRQGGTHYLGEIQALFPGTSDRTIRYDLEDLIEQGLIERVGKGGPGTCYQLKQEVV